MHIYKRKFLKQSMQITNIQVFETSLMPCTVSEVNGKDFLKKTVLEILKDFN